MPTPYVMLADTLAELDVVLRGWIEVKMAGGDRDFPIIDQVNLNVVSA